jgi:hypothetical protein
MLDWLVIGGGPHGVHLAFRLRVHGNVVRQPSSNVARRRATLPAYAMRRSGWYRAPDWSYCATVPRIAQARAIKASEPSSCTGIRAWR